MKTFLSNLLIVRGPNAACYRRFVVEHSSYKLLINPPQDLHIALRARSEMISIKFTIYLSLWGLGNRHKKSSKGLSISSTSGDNRNNPMMHDSTYVVTFFI